MHRNICTYINRYIDIRIHTKDIHIYENIYANIHLPGISLYCLY